MVMSDGALVRLINGKRLIEPNEIVRYQVNTCSIDLTIDGHYKRPVMTDKPWIYGRENIPYDFWRDETAEEYITLKSGECILACSQEIVNMPATYCGQIFTKSSLGRCFINHEMAGYIDAGFHGKITFELKNDGIHTVKIPVGARIVQMVVQKLDDEANIPYDKCNHSRYNGAMNCECSKAEKK